MTCNDGCTLQPVNLVSSSASLTIKEEIYQNTRTLRRWTILKRTGTLDACLSTLLELIPSLKCCSCLLSISTKHLHQPAQQEPQGGTAAAIQPFAINEDQTQEGKMKYIQGNSLLEFPYPTLSSRVNRTKLLMMGWRMKLTVINAPHIVQATRCTTATTIRTFSWATWRTTWSTWSTRPTTKATGPSSPRFLPVWFACLQLHWSTCKFLSTWFPGLCMTEFAPYQCNQSK